MSLHRLFDYTFKHRSQIYLASTYSILNKIADLAPPLLIGMAVDIVVKTENTLLINLGITNQTHQLIWLAVLTVVVWGTESVFEYLFQTKWRTIAQNLQHEFRIDTYTHIQSLDMQWYSQQKSGNLLSILNDDVNQLERFLNGGANALLQVGTTAICVSAVFIYVSPFVALLSIIPIPLILLGSFEFQKRIAPRYAKVREKAGSISAQLSNNLSGMETIKSFTSETWATTQVDSLSRSYLEANEDAITLSSAFSPLIRMVIVIGFTATLIYGGLQAIDGEIAVGEYSVLVFLTQRLLWPLTRLGETFDLYQRAMASSNRILDLLQTPLSIKDGNEIIDLASAKSIQFQNLDFAYPERPPLFQSLQLQLPLGKTIAFVGPTGSGKSSIVRILLRFYPYLKGDVLIDSTKLDDISLSNLRSQIGLVSQSVYLFDGSIAENIGLGKKDATEEEIQNAAKLAEIHDFIQSLPQGYQTRIGERGQRLSGGQQQRVSIARAVLKNPPLLILDEATSAVDNETEAAIQRSITKLSKERSIIIIAHRLSTIRNADVIYVLEDGKIVEQGRHDNLLENKSLYQRLWNIQTGTGSP